MTKSTYTLTQSESDFAFWSSLPSLSAATRADIEQSDIVLIPQAGFADYKELSLHSEIIRIATLLVKKLAAPVAISLIKDYLKKRLGSRLKKAEVHFHRAVGIADWPQTEVVGPPNHRAVEFRYHYLLVQQSLIPSGRLANLSWSLTQAME